jgi:hypothetical protein
VSTLILAGHAAGAYDAGAMWLGDIGGALSFCELIIC